MSIFFKEEFNNKILFEQKVGTIRNSKHLTVGTVFNVNIGDRFKSKNIGKAKCIALFQLETKKLINCINDCVSNDLRTIKYPLFKTRYFALSSECLGFDFWEEAIEFYEKSLKNEHCYLHIFELLDEEKIN